MIQIHKDGSATEKRAVGSFALADGELQTDDNKVEQLKVIAICLPGISKEVTQRKLWIAVDCFEKPYEMTFSPDDQKFVFLFPPDTGVHVQLLSLDANNRVFEYNSVDFYTNGGSPSQPSPLNIVRAGELASLIQESIVSLPPVLVIPPTPGPPILPGPAPAQAMLPTQPVPKSTVINRNKFAR